MNSIMKHSTTNIFSLKVRLCQLQTALLVSFSFANFIHEEEVGIPYGFVSFSVKTS